MTGAGEHKLQLKFHVKSGVKLRIVPCVVLHVGGRDRCRHKYQVNAGAGRDEAEGSRLSKQNLFRDIL